MRTGKTRSVHCTFTIDTKAIQKTTNEHTNRDISFFVCKLEWRHTDTHTQSEPRAHTFSTPIHVSTGITVKEIELKIDSWIWGLGTIIKLLLANARTPQNYGNLTRNRSTIRQQITRCSWCAMKTIHYTQTSHFSCPFIIINFWIHCHCLVFH